MCIRDSESTARYWANVEWLDEGCGQIVDHLKKEGLYENTVFVFTTDNGWVPDPKKVGRYVRSKREPVEAGIRTPIFVTHEGTVKPLRDAETLASNIDIAPTILKICGVEPSAQMKGLDLRKPEKLKERNRIFVDVYEHDSDLDQLDDLESGLKSRVVIDGWDKLIANKDAANQLYDLKKDDDDRNDLSSANQDKASALANIIDAWVTNKD